MVYSYNGVFLLWCISNYVVFLLWCILITAQQSPPGWDLGEQLNLNPFQHIDDFWRLWSTLLLKSLWKKEKLLKTCKRFIEFSWFLPRFFQSHLLQIWVCGKGLIIVVYASNADMAWVYDINFTWALFRWAIN